MWFLLKSVYTVKSEDKIPSIDQTFSNYINSSFIHGCQELSTHKSHELGVYVFTLRSKIFSSPNAGTSVKGIRRYREFDECNGSLSIFLLCIKASVTLVTEALHSAYVFHQHVCYQNRCIKLMIQYFKVDLMRWN